MNVCLILFVRCGHVVVHTVKMYNMCRTYMVVYHNDTMTISGELYLKYVAFYSSLWQWPSLWTNKLLCFFFYFTRAKYCSNDSNAKLQGQVDHMQATSSSQYDAYHTRHLQLYFTPCVCCAPAGDLSCQLLFYNSFLDSFLNWIFYIIYLFKSTLMHEKWSQAKMQLYLPSCCCMSSWSHSCSTTINQFLFNTLSTHCVVVYRVLQTNRCLKVELIDTYIL